MAAKDRLTRETLTNAVAHFSALADAYVRSEDADLEADRMAAETVRTIVITLDAFARARRVQDAGRARVAIASGLRGIYARVRGTDAGDTEAPPSRRTWHEGMWQTADERRAAIARIILRWIPSLDAAATVSADLSPEQIDAHGGASAAADEVVAALFAQNPDEASFRGATVFGLPL